MRLRHGVGEMTRTVLNAQFVRSLVWSGDELVDWVGGGARYRLDGIGRPGHVHFGFRFDAACAHGDYAVIYERLGTKGLILHGGEVLREIDRSYYCADDYDYPVCLWSDRSGRVLMAHCPERYNRIEIEDVRTGERLTSPADRQPEDAFHSRLQVSPCGRRLLSAGWIWHPLDRMFLFDIAAALRDARHLDAGQRLRLGDGLLDESSACWQDGDQLLIGGGERDDGAGARESGGATADRAALQGNDILIYDITREAPLRRIAMDRPAGPMMAFGAEAVVTFHGHPRLISLLDGRVMEEWPDLPTGSQISAIAGGSPLPPIALDPAKRRFAVARGGEIHVVTLFERT
jgi:hypothetical protein